MTGIRLKRKRCYACSVKENKPVFHNIGMFGKKKTSPDGLTYSCLKKMNEQWNKAKHPVPAPKDGESPESSIVSRDWLRRPLCQKSPQ